MEPIKILWKSEDPLWIEQWPLTKEKLAAAHQLVREQLQKQHIEHSTSPWNSPIFVIKKTSGKWRLLTDLRGVNNSMFPMGALQPGVPSPAALPRDWHTMVIDLQDCFFTIPVHKDDRKRFAFSLPSINRQGPHQRFQWKVLPQGMMNSPTMCQLYVDAALRPVRQKWPQVYIAHYMDDILFASPHQNELEEILKLLPEYFIPFGLVIAPEKIQKGNIINYLGYVIERNTVRPQKIAIRRDNLKTLNDFQKLLGDINWLRPSLGIPTYQLHNLFDTLQGNSDIHSPRQLTAEAEKELQFVEEKIKSAFLTRIDPSLPLTMYILNTWQYPTAIIGQKELPAEWIYTRHHFSKNITPYGIQIAYLIEQARDRAIIMTGCDIMDIIIPLSKDQFSFLLRNIEELQIALAGYVGQINYHFPKGKVWDCFRKQEFIIQDIISEQPLVNAPTVFTDGSKTKSAYWTTKRYWVQNTDFNSVQQNELFAIAQVLKDFPSAVNILADSAYAVGVVKNVYTAVVCSNKSNLLSLFLLLQTLLRNRNTRIYVTHIRSHTNLPGSLAYGNAQVDALVSFASADEEHNLLHTNAGRLHVQYKIPYRQAKQIIKQCPICRPLHLRAVKAGVNPRGTYANELWQMDVTHVAQFGRLSYVHVVIDTYSQFIWATAQMGETTQHVITHLLETFAVMGLPSSIKTDNGPAYKSKKFQAFCLQYGIMHKTGIEYNPQGQAIVERAHSTLKLQIKKLKRRKTDHILSFTQSNARSILSQVLFTLNFLNLPQGDILSRAEKQFIEGETAPLPLNEHIWFKPAADAEWQPGLLLYRGKGYAYVSTENGQTCSWLPARWIRSRTNSDGCQATHGGPESA